MYADGNNYMQAYETFWKALVAPDGELVLDAVARELYDYGMILDSVPEVYCHVTGGRISKPNTLPGAVIAEADDYENKTHYESMVDEIKIIKDKVCVLIKNEQSLKQVEKYFEDLIIENKRYAF